MKAETRVKLAGTVVAELFTLVTVVKVLGSGQWDRILLAFATVLLVLLPAGVEKLLRCRICLPVYLFGLFYAVGPMLGLCWNLYYTIHWWDRMLHVFGGLTFALFGGYWFGRLATERQKPFTVALFALVFSVAVAAVWEFIEFGADYFLGMDMQDDTVIDYLCSYLLGQQVGMTGRIDGISSVVIDGMALPVKGYIDIGLFDSMLDMMVESLGALAASLFLWLDKGKHSVIRPLPR